MLLGDVIKMTDVFDAFVLLGYAVITHLLLVNFILGLSIIIPLMEYYYYKKNDQDGKKILKNMFKFMILSDLFAGVWATWITVFLGGFWPSVTYIATTDLFASLVIALIGILIALPSIGIYWFTWDKISEKLHVLIGLFMAIGAIMVASGFNMIFAFIDDPVGLGSPNYVYKQNSYFSIYSNPLYPDFTLHRIFGALTLVSLTFAGAYIYSYLKNRNELSKKSAIVFIKIAMISLPIEVLLGFIYSLELISNTQYIANQIFWPLLNTSHYNALSILFIIFIIFIFFMWYLLYYLYFSIDKENINKIIPLTLSSLAIITFILGEFLNDYSRYPYFVITGNTGINASQFINNLTYLTNIWYIMSYTISLILLIIYIWLINRVIIKNKGIDA